MDGRDGESKSGLGRPDRAQLLRVVVNPGRCPGLGLGRAIGAQRQMKDLFFLALEG